MILDGTETQELQNQTITVNGLTFSRAIDVLNTRPFTARPAVRGIEPLYALPGGGRATHREINLMFQEKRHG